MQIRGIISLPGDKSISHRSLMLASLTNGSCVINNISTGIDVESTRICLEACGINSKKDGNKITITGGTFNSPDKPLNCGNSGTTARLMSGLLAGKNFNAEFFGDKSLSKRPMMRIIDPLTKMGVSIRSKNGHLPFTITSTKLNSIDYTIPISSAQVKSSIILAGLGSIGETKVHEKIKTRNHTEIMLKELGAKITIDDIISIHPLKNPLSPFELTVPGDPSSAAFFAAAAAMIPNSNLTIKNILANPLRIGLFNILEKMGICVDWSNIRRELGELVGDVNITSNSLHGLNVDERMVPSVIDEIPIIAILATQADSPTIIEGASELRVKESDRINAICHNLRSMGTEIIEKHDGFIINPITKLNHSTINTFGDHRIAMAFAIAGLLTSKKNTLDDTSCIDISFPEFFQILENITN